MITNKLWNMFEGPLKENKNLQFWTSAGREFQRSVARLQELYLELFEQQGKHWKLVIWMKSVCT